ncbi:hypothetical protein OIU84_012850 [Salix udensis]|uniref:Uncharacterized protein n=1 Tax=Salix udensis TaxID=889485 RepID=A0AAD6JGJ8_9ROSI|nr:hypothetical protein OIU84_012850 [Salix udensis]
MKGSKICSFLLLNVEGKKNSTAADQRMAVELAARDECSAEAGKLQPGTLFAVLVILINRANSNDDLFPLIANIL